MPKKTFDVKNDLVFASCKSWHKPLFERLKNKYSANWLYASSKEELDQIVLNTRPKYIFFLHWNWLVPEIILQTCECVCFHMTDVPYGRGGSPLQNLILAGHKETKLSALKMVKEMDAGPVYIKRPLNLEGTAQEIYIRAGKLSAEIIAWLIEHEPEPVPQMGEALQFKRRKPEQSVLPKTGSLSNMYDFIRMLDAEGYPHAFIEHGDYLMGFTKAKLENGRLIAEVEIKSRGLS